MSRRYLFVLLFTAALAGLTGCDKFAGAVKPAADNNAEQTVNAPRVKVETSAGDFIISLQPESNRRREILNHTKFPTKLRLRIPINSGRLPCCTLLTGQFQIPFSFLSI